MKVKTEIKYPCGYENKSEFELGFLDFGSFNTNDKPVVCPLHGKKCKKINEEDENE